MNEPSPLADHSRPPRACGSNSSRTFTQTLIVRGSSTPCKRRARLPVPLTASARHVPDGSCWVGGAGPWRSESATKQLPGASASCARMF